MIAAPTSLIGAYDAALEAAAHASERVERLERAGYETLDADMQKARERYDAAIERLDAVRKGMHLGNKGNVNALRQELRKVAAWAEAQEDGD